MSCFVTLYVDVVSSTSHTM